jgi:tyrocidine synthetase-3
MELALLTSKISGFARLYPHRIAIKSENRRVSYLELEQESNRVAKFFKGKIEEVPHVAVILDRSPRLMEVVVGLLKGGLVFVPLHPEFPPERVRRMIEASRAEWVVTSRGYYQKYSGALGDLKTLLVDEEPGGVDLDLPGRRFYLDEDVGGDDFVAGREQDKHCYIYFTSGSTGDPKGVLGRRGSLAHFIRWELEEFGINESFNVSQMTPPSFDPYLRDLLVPLAAGGTSCIPPADTLLEMGALVRWLEDNHITLVHTVPSLFKSLVSRVEGDHCFPGLRYILLAGEILRGCDISRFVQVFKGRIQLVNVYGPTETTLAKLFYRVRPEDVQRAVIPVGKPIDGAQALILDEKKRKCPPEREGEIYIRTPFMSAGYYNDPCLTKAVFIKNPFGKHPGDRLYKTGDLGRQLPDGNIEITGRVDFQVKIRGMRIEAGEIENRLLRHSDIEEAVVSARGDEGAEKYLCAYVVPVPGQKPAPAALKKHLAHQLPDYMIPAFFVYLEKMPLTPSGKINRRALPAPEIRASESFVGPRDPWEKQLAELWSDVLGIPHDTTGIDDNFFDLGGHSLKASVMAAKIYQAFDVNISLKDLFETATIREQAEYIKAAKNPLRHRVQDRYAALEPVEEREYYRLSPAQQRLYVLQQRDVQSTAYNIPMVVAWEGEPDRETLHRIFNQLVHSHEALRTSFLTIGGKVFQQVHEAVGFEMEWLENHAGDGTLRGFLRPFDLGRAPLFRVAAVKIASRSTGTGGRDTHRIMVDMHHIIADGTSTRLLLEAFIQARRGERPALPRLHYKDFSEWLGGKGAKEIINRQKAYWLEQFAGEIPVANLPIDYSRPPRMSFAGQCVDFCLGGPETRRLNELAAAEQVTLFTLLLGIFTLLLSRLTGQEDIVVGTGSAGRRHPELWSVIGLFVNTVVLRNRIRRGDTFRDFLSRVKENALGAFENQDYPFENLVGQLAVPREQARNPLFDVMLVFQNLDGAEGLEEAGLHIHRPFNRGSKFDLAFLGREKKGRLYFAVEYSRKLFKPATVNLFITYFKEIVCSVLAGPGHSLDEINEISPQRKERIIRQLNRLDSEKAADETGVEQPLQAGLAACAARVGGENSPALEHDGHTITYRELHQRSHGIAHWLIRQKKVLAETFIAVLSDHRPHVILALLGILKARCVFVPLDPGSPPDRLRTLLDTVGVDFVITDRGEDANGLGNRAECIYWDQLPVSPPRSFDRVPPGDYRPEDLIYVYFTSGSTGVPRPFAGKNRSLAHFVRWETSLLGVDENDRFSQLISPVFDAFLRDIFVPLCRGAAICIPRGTDLVRDGRQLVRWLDGRGITVVHCVPGILRSITALPLNPGHFKRLRFILLSGEKVDPTELRRWYAVFGRRIQLLNLWGTSETTLAKTCYFIQPQDTWRPRIPVGKPINGAEVAVLDKNMGICGVLVPGELYIYTPFRTAGYCNAPALNDERFIRPAFIENKKGRMHKTGDLGRILPCGNIDILGRNDRQVKIHGIRVEPEEIEALLNRHPLVVESVVVYKKVSAGAGLLCAYMVCRKSDREGISPADNALLADYLAEKLPAYMVPGRLIRLENLPRNPNGKIDYAALPDPLAEKGEVIHLPRSPVERKIRAHWAEVLGLPPEKLCITRSFFELGGNSLNIMSLLSVLQEEFHAQVGLGELFVHATIAAQAALVEKAPQKSYPSRQLPEPVEKMEYYPLSPAQQRLYLVHQVAPASTGYNIPQLLLLQGRLDREKLESAFARIIRQHEGLRTSFPRINDKPVQMVHDDAVCEIQYQEAEGGGEDGYSPKSWELKAKHYISSFLRPFDLTKAPLLRVGWVRGAKEEHLLMIDMHHIVSDGISINVLVGDFSAVYRGETHLPAKIHYKDFTLWQRSEQQRQIIQLQRNYWLEQFRGEVPLLNLPTDHPRPLVQDFAGRSLPLEIAEHEQQALRTLAREQGVTLFLLILSVYTVFLAALTGQDDIVVGTPTTGRSHPVLGSIIGMFVNTLALRNFPAQDKGFLLFLEEVKNRAVESFENQHYPFENLVEQLDLVRDTGRNPLFSTMFAFQDVETPGLGIPGFTIKRCDFEAGTAKFDLSLIGFETGGELYFELEYSTTLFENRTLERFIGSFKSVLSGITRDPAIKIGQIDIIAEEEKRLILAEFSCGYRENPGYESLGRLFAGQVEKNPDAVALTGVRGGLSCGLRLTYKELSDNAGQVACRLKEAGVRGDTIVAVMLERSAGMVIALLGILGAGGAYLPLDPSCPAEMFTYIKEDSGFGPLVDRDFLAGLLAAPPCRAPGWQPCPPANLAYVLYTSGSTGRPKGVMVEQRPVVNLLRAMANRYPLARDEGYVLKTSYRFDVSVTELFGWFWGGGRLVLLEPDGEKDPEKILDVLERERVTHINFVPSMFAVFSAALWGGGVRKLRRLKYIFLAGEELPGAVLERFRDLNCPVPLENLYGPTEATVYASWYSTAGWGGGGPVPIGRPLPGVTLYILDNWGHLRPIGVPGELCLGGEGLARGYLNQAELTRDKFDYDLWDHHEYHDKNKTLLRGVQGGGFLEKSPPGRRRQRLYRTGDLAKWLPDGNIEFLGRRDDQVKIRGFRVELGEIEKHLLDYTGVKGVVAVARTRGEYETYLCAYIISGTELKEEKLRGYLSGKLPDYMIPTYFVFLARFPLTVSGKIDRRRLPVPGPAVSRSCEPPSDDIERYLVGLWAEVLAIDPAVIGIDGNFFQLGGNSLNATLMNSRAQKHCRVAISLGELFKAPTVRQMAAYIKCAVAVENVELLNDTNLVLLSKGGPSSAHFFILHAGSGEVEGYVEFCNHFIPRFNCWGLRADRLVNCAPRNVSIREMSRLYLEKIEKVQARGPYYLAGWCIGGTIAFELINLLEQRGEEVKFFGMINAAPPVPGQSAGVIDFTPATEAEELGKFLPSEEFKEKLEAAGDLQQLWGLLVDYLLDNNIDPAVVRKNIPPHISRAIPNFDNQGIRELIFYSNMIRSLNRARSKYIPAGKNRTAIHFFGASQTVIHNRDEWNKYIDCPLKFYEVTGDHFSIFKPPNALPFGRIFSRVMGH